MTDKEEHSSYNAYIESEQWRARARRIRDRDNGRCAICGTTSNPLEVHHLTYDRLYDESDDDLIMLCHECHEKVTSSWHSVLSGVKARNHFLYSTVRKYKHALDIAKHVNVLMPHDIAFGGQYTLTGWENIKRACEDIGIEYKHAACINDIFAEIHTFDAVTKINNGVPKWRLIEDGYSQSFINSIGKRQEKHDNAVSRIDDALICFIHEGQGKWTVAALEDGLDTSFIIRFVPFMRYENMWWDDERTI